MPSHDDKFIQNLNVMDDEDDINYEMVKINPFTLKFDDTCVEKMFTETVVSGEMVKFIFKNISILIVIVGLVSLYELTLELDWLIFTIRIINMVVLVTVSVLMHYLPKGSKRKALLIFYLLVCMLVSYALHLVCFRMSGRSTQNSPLYSGFLLTLTSISSSLNQGWQFSLAANFILVLMYIVMIVAVWRVDFSNSFIIVVIIGSLVFVLISYLTERNNRRGHLSRALMKKQEAQSHGLLSRMLPSSVVAKLRIGEKEIVNTHKCVSVLFSHICNFGAFTAKLKAPDVVRLLNNLFSCFDSITDDMGVYKIETIGDVYLVSSGCPIEYKANNHSALLCTVAIRMQQALQASKFVFDRVYNPPVQVRIGIHSGKVIAGVVGMKYPRYRLMSDTVNTASRMSTTCQPGDIQLSEDAHQEMIKWSARNEFVTAARGSIAVKGKGFMNTFLLTKQIHQQSVDGENENSGTGVEEEEQNETTEDQRTKLLITTSMLPQSEKSLSRSAKLGSLTRSADEEIFYLDVETLLTPDKPWYLCWDYRFTTHPQIEEIWHQHSFEEHEGSIGTRALVLTVATLQFPFALMFNSVYGASREDNYQTVVVSSLTLLLGVVYAVGTSFGRSFHRKYLHIETLLVVALLTASVMLVCVGITAEFEVAFMIMFLSVFVPKTLGPHVIWVFFANVIVIAISISMHFGMRSLAMHGREVFWDAILLLLVGGYLSCQAAMKNEKLFRREFLYTYKRKRENERASTFINTMLPPSVIKEITSSRKEFIAAEFEDVSVLFCDIVSFTKLSARISAEDVVAILNLMFNKFDEITTKNCIYKVETIGDCYMACSNIINIGELQTQKLIETAMEFQTVTKTEICQSVAPIVLGENSGQPVETALKVRIGIHTGTCMAGVVGKKMPRYHLFGETVTVAEEMEQGGIPGEVCVSAKTKLSTERADARMSAMREELWASGHQNASLRATASLVNALQKSATAQDAMGLNSPKASLHSFKSEPPKSWISNLCNRRNKVAPLLKQQDTQQLVERLLMSDRNVPIRHPFVFKALEPLTKCTAPDCGDRFLVESWKPNISGSPPFEAKRKNNTAAKIIPT